MVLYDSMFFIFFCKPVGVVKRIPLRDSCFAMMEVSATSKLVVIDSLARASANSLPIIPAWDFTLRKSMGDGDWWIAVAMDWKTSP